MARIRSVHPGICSSEDLVDLPAEVERTYVRLWTHCDDFGRCRDNVRLIKAGIYPLHDDMTVSVLDEHLWELHRRGHLVRYSVENKDIIQVANWDAYQKPQRKTTSKLPTLDEGSPRTPPSPEEPSASPRVHVAEDVVPGGEGRGEGVGGDTRESLESEPSLTLVESPGTSADADGAFDDWWQGYPRKVDKAKARTAYHTAVSKGPKASRPTPADLTAALELQRTAWQRENRPTDKIPHATTWLNGRRWEDEDLRSAPQAERPDGAAWMRRTRGDAS